MASPFSVMQCTNPNLPHRITTRPKPTPSTTNVSRDIDVANMIRRRSQQQQQHYDLNYLRTRLVLWSPPTSIIPYNRYLDALVRNSDPSVFSFFNRITQTEGISPDDYTYGIMINYCVQMKQLNLAFSFLGRLLKEGQRAKAATINPILKALCSENRIGEAACIVIDKMPKLRCIPNVISYNILIKGLCSKGNTGLVLQLFFKMAKHGGEYEPCAITYSTVIDELCKVGELAKAFCLYKQMYSAGVLPDTVTYSSLINGLCKKGETEKANKVLRSMVSKGLKPNVVTYNSLIDGLCKNGEINEAKELLCRMISKGLEPNVVTYNTLIDGLCKKGKIEKANKMLRIMYLEGPKPNVVTYNTLINWLCKKGEIHNIKELLHNMISKGHVPDGVTYYTLFVGLQER
ncbi:uncharacterized protein LOC144568144 isoform X2 [Carex rostrata]